MYLCNLNGFKWFHMQLISIAKESRGFAPAIPEIEGQIDINASFKRGNDGNISQIDFLSLVVGQTRV
jgi:hypothetical protein